MNVLPKGGDLVKDRKSVSDMEKEFDLDKVKPIAVTPSSQYDFEDDEGYWDDLYKKTLEEIYEQI